MLPSRQEMMLTQWWRRPGRGPYLVSQVGKRCDPGCTVDGGGQLLEVCNHTAAARVEWDGDVCSIRCLQAPAHHIRKLEQKSTGRTRGPAASLVMAELHRTEEHGVAIPFQRLPLYASSWAYTEPSPSTASRWPVTKRSSQIAVTIYNVGLIFLSQHTSWFLTFSRCSINVQTIYK